MKTYLRKTAILIALFVSSISAHEACSLENTVEENHSQLSEMTFVVSLQDLIFDGGEISINWEGINYPISSLEREGDHWVARMEICGNYCPEGHNLCRRCGLCHLRGCRYYIPPCWQ